MLEKSNLDGYAARGARGRSSAERPFGQASSKRSKPSRRWARETIRNWLDTTNGQSANSCNHDSRQKLTKEQRQEIFVLADSGSTYRGAAHAKAMASRPRSVPRTLRGRPGVAALNSVRN